MGVKPGLYMETRASSGTEVKPGLYRWEKAISRPASKSFLIVPGSSNESCPILRTDNRKELRTISFARD